MSGEAAHSICTENPLKLATTDSYSVNSRVATLKRVLCVRSEFWMVQNETGDNTICLYFAGTSPLQQDTVPISVESEWHRPATPVCSHGVVYIQYRSITTLMQYKCLQGLPRITLLRFVCKQVHRVCGTGMHEFYKYIRSQWIILPILHRQIWLKLLLMSNPFFLYIVTAEKRYLYLPFEEFGLY